MNSNILLRSNKDYFCDVCDKTIKPKSINEHPKSLTYIQYEKRFRINHTFRNPCFFDVDKIFITIISLIIIKNLIYIWLNVILN